MPTFEQMEMEAALIRRLRSAGVVIVAYSGGVDSTYLASVATTELGGKAVCITGISPSVSREQQERATRLAKKHGFCHQTVKTREMEDQNYVSNPSNRCYFCKKELYGVLSAIASDASDAVVMDGTNADDLQDHRPGRIAADELGVQSPLAELGFTKSDIRELSRIRGLETWDIPASPCLSSRIPYGTPVTIERLSKIEKGEAFLKTLGFREFRVRSIGKRARLEFSESDLSKALSIEETGRLAARFAEFGFSGVSVDARPFRSGSMNSA